MAKSFDFSNIPIYIYIYILCSSRDVMDGHIFQGIVPSTAWNFCFVKSPFYSACTGGWKYPPPCMNYYDWMRMGRWSIPVSSHIFQSTLRQAWTCHISKKFRLQVSRIIGTFRFLHIHTPFPRNYPPTLFEFIATCCTNFSSLIKQSLYPSNLRTSR